MSAPAPYTLFKFSAVVVILSILALSNAFAQIPFPPTPAVPGTSMFAYVQVSKGINYTQLGSATVRLNTYQPYQFSAFVNPIAVTNSPPKPDPPAPPGFPNSIQNNSIQSASVRTPNGRRHVLSNTGTFFYFSRGFSTRRALDVAFTNGVYTARVNALFSSASLAIPLRGGDYPTTPRILNWDAAQDIDASADFELQWAPFVNARSQDAISLDIRNAAGTFVRMVPLRATASGYLIRGGTLEAGESYTCRLFFFHRKRMVTSATHPGLSGNGGYSKTTLFTITTR